MAAWMSMALSSEGSPQALPTIMAGVMMPMIAAITCWSAKGTKYLGEGLPSRSNSDAGSPADAEAGAFFDALRS